MSMENLKESLYESIIELLKDDAEGRGEELKEFWEACETEEEVKQGEKLLKKLIKRLESESKE